MEFYVDSKIKLANIELKLEDIGKSKVIFGLPNNTLEVGHKVLAGSYPDYPLRYIKYLK